MAEFNFSEAPEGVGFEVRAETREQTITASIKALSIFLWDTGADDALIPIEIAAQGPTLGTALLALLSEALFRADLDRVVFHGFDLQSISRVPDPRKNKTKPLWELRGSLSTSPLDPGRHQVRNQVNAVLLPRLKWEESDQGCRFFAVLDA